MQTIAEHVERLLGESLIGMAETGRAMGVYRGGRPMHSSTPTRWCIDGVLLPDGSRLRLEHIRVAGRLMTSREALARFIAAQQDLSTIPDAAPPRSPAQRARASEAAERELDRLGVR